MGPARDQSEPIQPRLSLWDAICIIVGIIIGVGIFEVPGRVLERAPGPWEAVGVWALGGLLALVGALCFAELSSTYPRSGGEYVYLQRAYGPSVGFLFAWAQLAVIRPAGIAALAFIFASHADDLWGLEGQGAVLLAVLSIVALTVINIVGVSLGSGTQNILTLAKVLGLAAIVGAGWFWADPQPVPLEERATMPGWFAQAMIFVLWTYAGWHEAAYVASEVRDSRRNLPLALIAGTAAVTLIYLLVNAAVLIGLGYEVARGIPERQVMANVLDLAPLENAGAVFALLVMVSALGANNGMIFTTARIYSAFGSDHRLFDTFSHWSRRLGTPVRALIVQAVLSSGYVIGVSLRWKDRDGFDALVDSTAAVFWLFFLLTGIALFMLRYQEPDQPRPFRVPGYPVLPLIFCGWCGYMVYGAINYAKEQSLIGLAILLVGLPFYFIPQKRRRREATEVVEQTPVPLPSEQITNK
jgi:APA family basic amino acid/polyamine antiporter